jgi:hypothetical protein
MSLSTERQAQTMSNPFGALLENEMYVVSSCIYTSYISQSWEHSYGLHTSHNLYIIFQIFCGLTGTFWTYCAT